MLSNCFPETVKDDIKKNIYIYIKEKYTSMKTKYRKNIEEAIIQHKDSEILVSIYIS